jgi:hypothetical protein
MNDQAVGSPHRSFWAIGAAALIWNAMGAMNFFMQMDANVVASMPETHRAIIEGRPVWATVGFAISVFGGALGGLLLLLKKWAAYPLFIASLLGTIVTMVHTLGVGSSTTQFSPFELFMMILMPLLVPAFLVWYAKQAEGRGWIG